jgi:hypothetical protein
MDIDVYPDQVFQDPNGTKLLSVLATAYPPQVQGANPYGFITDQVLQDGGVYSLALNQNRSPFVFNVSTGVTGISIVGKRKGVQFLVGGGSSGGNAQTSLTFDIADKFPCDYYRVNSINIASTGDACLSFIKQFAYPLSNPVNITMPSAAVTSLSYSNGTINWSLSGSSEKDILAVIYDFIDQNGNEAAAWVVGMNPTKTSWKESNLQLPVTVSSWLQGLQVGSVGVEATGSSTASGYDDFVTQYFNNPFAEPREIYTAARTLQISQGQSVKNLSNTQNSEIYFGPKVSALKGVDIFPSTISFR